MANHDQLVGVLQHAEMCTRYHPPRDGAKPAHPAVNENPTPLAQGHFCVMVTTWAKQPMAVSHDQQQPSARDRATRLALASRLASVSSRSGAAVQLAWRQCPAGLAFWCPVGWRLATIQRSRSTTGATDYVSPEGQRQRKINSDGMTYFAPDASGPLVPEGDNGRWVDYV